MTVIMDQMMKETQLEKRSVKCLIRADDAENRCRNKVWKVLICAFVILRQIVCKSDK